MRLILRSVVVAVLSLSVVSTITLPANAGSSPHPHQFSRATIRALNAIVDTSRQAGNFPGAIVGIWIPGRGSVRPRVWDGKHQESLGLGHTSGPVHNSKHSAPSRPASHELSDWDCNALTVQSRLSSRTRRQLPRRDREQSRHLGVGPEP